MLTQQGLWALLEYRLAQGGASACRSWDRSSLSGRRPWRRRPGISARPRREDRARASGSGTSARIIVHDAAVLGSHCHLCQGVTIGRGICREGYGVPVIGDGVYVGPNATVLGSITIGDRARIAANTVVTESVPADAYVHPAPVAVEPSFVGYCEGTLGVSPSR